MADLQIVISALNQASNELRRVAGDIQKLDRAAGNVSGAKGATSQFGKLQSALAATGLQSTALGGQFAQISTAANGLGIAAAGAAVGVGAVAIGIGKSVGAAIAFETSLTKVAKTAGFSDEQTKQFGNTILELSKRLPVSANALNEIAVVAGQLGISGGANLALFTEEIAKLSSTTGVGAAELATSLGQIAQITGFPIADIGQLSSAITQLGNDFASTESQILEFTTRIAGIGVTVGLNAVQLTAISSALSSVGVQAERGGTAVQSVLIEMQKAANDGGEALEAFGAVTRQTGADFAKLFQANPQEALTLFVEGIAAAGDDATAIFERLGLADDRLLSSFLALAAAGPRLRDSFTTANNAARLGTATNEEYARSLNTTAAQMQLLKNNINVLAIQTGAQFLPAVNATVSGLIKFSSVLNDVGPQIKAVADALGTGVVKSFQSWSAAIDDVKKAIDSLNLSMPILVGAAIVLGAALVFLFPGAALLVGLGLVIAGVGALSGEIDGASTAALNLKLTFINAIVTILIALGELAASLESLDDVLPGDPFANMRARIRETRNDVYLLGQEIQTVLDFRGASAGVIASAKLDPRFALPEGDARRTQAELSLLKRLDELGVGVSKETKPASPTGSPFSGGGPIALPPGAGALSKGLSDLDKVMQSAADGVITLAESIELGLTDAQVVALELAAAQNKVAEEEYRRRIGLQALAAAFPGLNGEQVKFQLGLRSIADHLRATGESIEKFILDTSTAALDGFKSAFDAIFSKPTREDAALQLELDEAKRRKLLAGEGASDAQKKRFDAEIDRIANLIAIRSNQDDITKGRAVIADNTLLTDVGQDSAANLYIAAIDDASDSIAANTGIVYLQTLANIGLKDQTLGLTTAFAQLNDSVTNATPLSLSDALVALAGLPDGGVSLLPSYASGTNYVPRDMIANIHKGEQIIPAGQSAGQTVNVTTYITADSQASEAAMQKLARMVEERAETAVRKAAFRGSYVTSGAYTPA